MKIISYNVNGIRAAIKKGFINWVAETSPDVLCLQEIKALREEIPTHLFEALGYSCHWLPAQKRGYSGVGMLSKVPPDDLTYGAPTLSYEQEGRIIKADFPNFSVLSIYIPSGTSSPERQAFKMQWLTDFQQYIQQLQQQSKPLILSGDFNICHHPIDIHDPVGNKKSSGFLPEERDWLGAFLGTGFVDSFRHRCADPDHYSWWSYRHNSRGQNKGWRIDYHLLSTSLVPCLQQAYMLPEACHADHCPVVVELDC